MLRFPQWPRRFFVYGSFPNLPLLFPPSLPPLRRHEFCTLALLRCTFFVNIALNIKSFSFNHYLFKRGCLLSNNPPFLSPSIDIKDNDTKDYCKEWSEVNSPHFRSLLWLTHYYSKPLLRAWY